MSRPDPTPDPGRDLPRSPRNAPRQAELEYRVLDWASCRERMLARLPLEEIPDGDHQGRRPLARLARRESDDPAIALIDAWAVVCDVLTFYQERFANEHYLRTAVERRSVLELARMVGYELSPGAAAGAFLAFTVDDAPGSPLSVRVPASTRVQSIPTQDALPQTFETSEEIVARQGWNALLPRQRQPQELQAPAELYLDGTATLLVPGDPLLLVIERAAAPPDTAVVVVRRALADDAAALTRVELEAAPLYSNLSGRVEGAASGFLAERVTSGFEITAAGQRRTVVSVESASRLTVDRPFRPPLVPGSVLEVVGAGTVTSTDVTVTGAGTAFTSQVVAGQVIVVAGQERRVEIVNLANQLTVDSPFDPPITTATPFTVRLSGTASSLAPPIAGDPVRVFAPRQTAPVFGHNAPLFDGLPDPNAAAVSGTIQGDPFPFDWDGPEGWEVWDDPLAGDPGVMPPRIDEWADADLYLEGTVGGILSGDWALLESPRDGFFVYSVSKAVDASLTGFALSGKATGLLLSRPGGSDPLTAGDPVEKPSELKVRETVAHLGSEELTLVDRPIAEPVPPAVPDAAAGDARTLVLDDAEDDLRPGQWLALTGLGPAGESLAEIAFLRAVDRQDPLHPRLSLRDDLRHVYQRESLRINANVALATHGETVEEILGSGGGGNVGGVDGGATVGGGVGGNAERSDQRMRLGQPPLTFLPAPNPRGIASTLVVRVDNVLWREAPSRAELGPGDRAYLLRIDDRDRAALIFGDGRRGARLPSGDENVTATYRSGIGLDGNVPADSLSLLATRPLGIRDVTNPVAAAGGVPRDGVEEARAKAPVTARTRGRIVSLRDFADFAGAMTGVARVFAVPLQGVHLSVAGIGGAPLLPGSALFENLRTAIEAARLPGPRVRIDPYEPLFFRLAANLILEPDRLAEVVLREAERALAGAFAFERRDFGQPVYASEILAVLQKISGVIAVDLDSLYLATEEPRFQTVLAARSTRLEGLRVRPAQLLRLDPDGVVLREVRA